MADLPPRYAYRIGPGERDVWADEDDSSMPRRELDTRRWMLVTAAVGAGVLVVAVAGMLVLGGGRSRPFSGDEQATATNEQASAPVATSGAAAGGAGAASAPSTSNADARQLADARAGLAAMETQLRATTERADDLDRRLAALEQASAITSRRADAAEASLAEQQSERARIQRDLDAISGDLSQANADRAALRVQLQDAQALAASSRAQVGSLSAEADQLRTCLAVHKEALYYSALDNWGLLATAMQGAAASCAAELG